MSARQPRRDRDVVATAEKIPPGGRKIVKVASRAIGVFNLDGEFYALRKRCPHQGAALCTEQLWSPLESDTPAEYRSAAERSMLASPHHGWEFDIRTGQSWCDPQRLRVRSYEAAAVSGRDLDADVRDSFNLTVVAAATTEAAVGQAYENTPDAQEKRLSHQPKEDPKADIRQFGFLKLGSSLEELE
jgi:3-phenylpropionate/trans-cinnamate dioxygenase ferredoxin subunit